MKQCKEICTVCNPIEKPVSETENELAAFVKKHYNGDIILNDRNILNGKELDIYLPELKLAIEFNGLYWHSEMEKYDNYHVDKTNTCEKQDIQLIHIFEDDWNFKQDIVKSMLLNKFKRTDQSIFARNCF
jgi:very-short-patch-repair endonuclease